MSQTSIFEYQPDEKPEDEAVHHEMEETSTAIMVKESLVPADIFKDGGAEELLKQIEQKARSFVPDISTEKGRKAIKSLNWQIARTKSTLDEMGKDLGDDHRRIVESINKERRSIKLRLESLQEEVTAPLKKWEERIKWFEDELDRIESQIGGPLNFDVSPEEIDRRLDDLKNADKIDWQEFSDRAAALIVNVKEYLASAKFRRMKEIEDARELTRLKREEEERKQKERDEAIAREAAEKARLEAEAKAKEEADRQARLAEQARLDVQRQKEQAERERAEAEERAKKAEEDRIAAEERAKADAEAAEIKRLADIEQARKDEEARLQKIRDDEAAETAKREADKAHKAKIHNEIKDALQIVIDDGALGDDPVKDMVIAIASGKIPHVKIIY